MLKRILPGHSLLLPPLKEALKTAYPAFRVGFRRHAPAGVVAFARSASHWALRAFTGRLAKAYERMRLALPESNFARLARGSFLTTDDVNTVAEAACKALEGSKVTPPIVGLVRELARMNVVEILPPSTAAELALLVGSRAPATVEMRIVIVKLLWRVAQSRDPNLVLASTHLRDLPQIQQAFVFRAFATHLLAWGYAAEAADVSRHMMAHVTTSPSVQTEHAVTLFAAGAWDDAFLTLDALPTAPLCVAHMQTILPVVDRFHGTRGLEALIARVATRHDIGGLAALCIAALRLPKKASRIVEQAKLAAWDRKELEDALAIALLASKRSAGGIPRKQVSAIRTHILPLLDERLRALAATLLFEVRRGTVEEEAAISRYLATMGRSELNMERGFERLVALEGIYEIDELVAGLRGRARRHTFADILGNGAGATLVHKVLDPTFFAENLKAHRAPLYALDPQPRLALLTKVQLVAEKFPMIGSAQDLEATENAKRLSETVAETLFPGHAASDDAEVVSEIFSLGLWDILVTPARALWTISDLVRKNGKQILVVATTDYALAVAYATALKRSAGVKVFLVNAGSADRYVSVIQSVAAEDDRPEHVARAAFATEKGHADLKRVSARDLMAGVLDRSKALDIFGANQRAGLSPSSTRTDALLLAAAANVNYRIAAQEIMRAAKGRLNLAVINLTKRDTTLGPADQVACVEDMDRSDRDLNVYCEADLPRVLDAISYSYQTNDQSLALASLHQIAHFLTIRLPKTLAEASLVQERIHASDVRSLITSSGRQLTCRAATLYANRIGVLTIDVQAFFISDHPRYRKSLAAVYCGTIEEQIDLYRRTKAPPPGQEILRIGSLPIAYRIRDVVGLRSEQARARNGLPAHAKVVMYAAQHGGAAMETMKIVSLLATVLRTRADTFLIAKLHPSSPEAQKQDVLGRLEELGLKDRAKVYRDEDIYDLIVASDLIVTQFSNVGLEAAVLDKQTLAVNLTDSDYPVDLHAMGVSEQALSEDEVKAAIEALLFDADTQKNAIARRHAFFARNPEIRSGDGAEKIIALLTAAGQNAARARS